MAGGRGRGRGRGGGGGGPAPDALPSAGPSAGPSTAATPGSRGSAGGRRACEVCEAAPGIPFCRVEWSFLCSSCGPSLHRDSWIVAVPPFPPGPTPPTTSTDASSQVSPYFFPPFMQMPLNPMQLPVPIPTHPPNTNTNASAAGVKKRRRRTRFTSASKEQTPGAAGTNPDPNPNPNPDPDMDRLKRKSRPPPAPTRADAGNVYADLHTEVQGTTAANVPQSAEDGAQLDTMESIAAEMEPPPPELDEIEQGIEAQREL